MTSGISAPEGRCSGSRAYGEMAAGESVGTIKANVRGPRVQEPHGSLLHECAERRCSRISQVLGPKPRHVEDQYGTLRRSRSSRRGQQGAENDCPPNPHGPQVLARALQLAIALRSTGYEALVMPKVGFDA